MSRVKIDFDLCDKVFVYGTLKSGYGNNRLLEDCDLLGTFTTRDYFLLLDSGCPVAVPESLVQADREPVSYGGSQSTLEWLYGASDAFYEPLPVRGEVWQLPAPYVFHRLDRLEGHPSVYYRSLVQVGEHWCWMYQWPFGVSEAMTVCPMVDGAYQWQ